MELDGDFARLTREFGGEREQKEESEDEEEIESDKKGKLSMAEADKARLKAKLDLDKVEGKGKLEGRLIVKEQRTTGAVPWYSECRYRLEMSDWKTDNFAVYGTYLKAGNGYITVPLVLLCMILMQGSAVLNSYTLVFWENK